jgi:hypothetical protein
MKTNQITVPQLFPLTFFGDGAEMKITSENSPPLLEIIILPISEKMNFN